MNTPRLPTYFITHGGGPWPYVPEMHAAHRTLEASLHAIPAQLGQRPRALLMISAHWITPRFSAMSGAQPPMLYDYYGFPEQAYAVQYPAPGEPELARRVLELLASARIDAEPNDRRGFDHGAFVPAAVMYPQADIPMLQLSLRAGFDPAAHIAAGRALAPLRDEGVLIIGSGSSYHNLRASGAMAQDSSKRFDDWLQQAIAAPAAERTAALIDWEKAPAARLAHPQEEHLLPLMVALGAAEADAATSIYHENTFFGGVTASSFRFG
jgi:aromatic ring-opening dioxygenase catalytic subunit (LigB family)